MCIRCPPHTGHAGSGVGQGLGGCVGAGLGLGSFRVILAVYRIRSPRKVDEVFHQIRSIIESDWPAILRIQSEAYYAIVPESESVMRSKAMVSPATCLVATDSDDRVLAYLLAYPYPDDRILPLGTIYLSSRVESDNLFLHDLAVARSASGRGIAKSLVKQVICAAQPLGYQTMSLVAIQDANCFWSKMGFFPTDDIPIDSTYAVGAQLMTCDLSTFTLHPSIFELTT